MYLAELHGKLSSRAARQEDILTSNVFSFFKYSNRRVFLQRYLKELGISVSEADVDRAEFIFWPRFEEGTEPDLVIRVGGYYILVEAKYFSGFGQETETSPAQLLREIKAGSLEAKNNSEKFRVIAITADHYYKEDKFQIIPAEFLADFRWANWQGVCFFLESVLDEKDIASERDLEFASDLHSLLDKKNLRGFKGFLFLANMNMSLNQYDMLFFEASTAKFRGSFIGFEKSLSGIGEILPLNARLFLDTKGRREFFTSLETCEHLEPVDSEVFWKGV
jgi:hypothetical protein